ncbi:Scramblase [Dictyocaulus viviparus]|uniref:Phospholipid scramblase n=1 Tax=Dictyocaulus viviparus TaxID=29172 RepID=A0A0D8XNB1_DICVI|nr:Scramblase [Dictyocaulus viviparus]
MITNQPTGVPLEDGAIGLESLQGINAVLIQQKLELAEIVLDVETQNQYDILTMDNKLLFRVAEQSSFCVRCCCRNRRGFSMHVMDGNKNSANKFLLTLLANLHDRSIILKSDDIMAVHVVMKVNRSFQCCQCRCACIFCSCDKINVEAPPGKQIGFVRQKCGLTIKLDVFDADENKFAYIIGPTWCCGCYPCCGREKVFKIYSSRDDSCIGTITKLWGGVIKEFFTDADSFKVEFPIDMSIPAKAVLIGTAFLIDFIAFEDNQPKKKDNS